MKNWEDIIQQDTFRYIDHSAISTFHNESFTALHSFAIDDALALSISNKFSPSTLRLWVHENTIVLGIPDAKLPYIDEGIQLLKKAGFQVIIRNSGGLAVALDDGVLNISLILPGVKDLSIHEGYEAMVSFVKHILKDLTDQIEAYEIINSYCPGEYDLSIKGKKFAGISQRRVKNGVAVQIYLDIEGNSYKRATLIKNFYETSKKGESTKFSYPSVDPNVMASLSDLLRTKLTVKDIKERITQALADFNNQIIESPFSEPELADYQKRLEQMKKRNERIRNEG
ncbi:lipoate--protein ligase family protein [Virgibacillus salexigens]|uniref:lipoate--protein ligase family protein n=1 Tax=Virgibacillus TaxID=84406 RepID=UPI00136A8DB1|nr:MULTISPECIES: lipoate--protein ligase family protein [Virgibacillus]MYL40940.1 octanoyltransferase [Virgibacillus massiliensis]